MRLGLEDCSLSHSRRCILRSEKLPSQLPLKQPRLQLSKVQKGQAKLVLLRLKLCTQLLPQQFISNGNRKQMPIGLHANLADPLTISAPSLSHLSSKHPPIPRKRAEKGVTGRNLESESICTKSTRVYLEDPDPAHRAANTHSILSCVKQILESAACPALSTLLLILLGHSPSQSKYQQLTFLNIIPHMLSGMAVHFLYFPLEGFSAVILVDK